MLQPSFLCLSPYEASGSAQIGTTGCLWLGSWWPSGSSPENGWTDRRARKQSPRLCEGMSRAGAGMAEACSDETGEGPASWDSKPSKPWADSKSLAALGPSEESPDPLAGIEGDRCFSLVLGLLSPNQPRIWVFRILPNNRCGRLIDLTGPQVTEDSSQAALPVPKRGTETPPRRPQKGLQAQTVTSWAGRIESGPPRLTTSP